jgi:hypothetical protein
MGFQYQYGQHKYIGINLLGGPFYDSHARHDAAFKCLDKSSVQCNYQSATGPIMNVPLNAQNCLFAEVIPAPLADWCPPHVFSITGPGDPAFVGSGWSQTVGLPAGPAAIFFLNNKQRAGECVPLMAAARSQLEPTLRQFAPKSAN